MGMGGVMWPSVDCRQHQSLQMEGVAERVMRGLRSKIRVQD